MRKVAEKLFVGKNIIHLAIFKKNDKRTIYNVVYCDGKNGSYFMKRFFVTGITRDKEYDLTKGTANSKVLYFTANPNGEAETIRIMLKPKPRLRSLVFEQNFSELAIKGRSSIGNILTKNDIHKITLKQKGVSTLGGRKIYFDKDVLRLNSEGGGLFLGEFKGEDKRQGITTNGEFYHTSFDLANHYDVDVLFIEKYNSRKVYSVALYDADQKNYYLKRFNLDVSLKRQSFIGENNASKMILISSDKYPVFKVTFGGGDAYREAMEIDVEEFISVKGFKAKGKRISTFEIGEITALEPMQKEGDEDLSEDEDLDMSHSTDDLATDDDQPTLF